MLGEVPPVVNGGTKEISKAVEGATPFVGQNEQTKKVCQHRWMKTVFSTRCIDCLMIKK